MQAWVAQNPTSGRYSHTRMRISPWDRGERQHGAGGLYSTKVGDHLTLVWSDFFRGHPGPLCCVPATAVGLRRTYRCRSRDHIDVIKLSLSLSRTQPPYRTSLTSHPSSRESISSSSCCHGMDGWRSADNARCARKSWARVSFASTLHAAGTCRVADG